MQWQKIRQKKLIPVASNQIYLSVGFIRYNYYYQWYYQQDKIFKHFVSTINEKLISQATIYGTFTKKENIFLKVTS